MRISHFLIPIGNGDLTVLLFSIPFGSIYHMRTFILRQNRQLLICFRMVSTHIITQAYNDSLTLTHPPNIHIWQVLPILMPTSRIFDTIYWCWLLVLCIHLYTRPTLVKHSKHSWPAIVLVRLVLRRQAEDLTFKILKVKFDPNHPENCVPRQRTLTMIPWLSSIESTYSPVPEHVAHSTAPLASHNGHRGLFPIGRIPFGKPVGGSIFSSGIPVTSESH
jgi:hypothetical protein